MNYIKRLLAAVEKHPEKFATGVMDCHVKHDGDCDILKCHAPSSCVDCRCGCDPVLTLTARCGKYDIDAEGNCRKLGIEGETIPARFDPRPTS